MDAQERAANSAEVGICLIHEKAASIELAAFPSATCSCLYEIRRQRLLCRDPPFELG